MMTQLLNTDKIMLVVVKNYAQVKDSFCKSSFSTVDTSISF